MTDTEQLEKTARAIAQDGFGRGGDDFEPVNAFDTDHGDLMEYAEAALASTSLETYRKALEEIAGEQKIYLGHGDYSVEPNYSAQQAQNLARKALGK